MNGGSGENGSETDETGEENGSGNSVPLPSDTIPSEDGDGGADESTGEQAESADDGDVAAAVAVAVLALVVWSLFGGSARSRPGEEPGKQGGR